MRCEASLRSRAADVPTARTEVVLTFDNLGEAAPMRNAACPLVRPPHPSVAVVLPRELLELLDRHQLHATFFVEAVQRRALPRHARRDPRRRPRARLPRLAPRELFGQLPPSARPAILDRSLATLRGAGVSVDGFRPPGGTITGYDLALQRAPAGSAGVRRQARRPGSITTSSACRSPGH